MADGFKPELARTSVASSVSPVAWICRPSQRPARSPFAQRLYGI